MFVLETNSSKNVPRGIELLSQNVPELQMCLFPDRSHSTAGQAGLHWHRQFGVTFLDSSLPKQRTDTTWVLSWVITLKGPTQMPLTGGEVWSVFAHRMVFHSNEWRLLKAGGLQRASYEWWACNVLFPFSHWISILCHKRIRAAFIRPCHFKHTLECRHIMLNENTCHQPEFVHL